MDVVDDTVFVGSTVEPTVVAEVLSKATVKFLLEGGETSSRLAAKKRQRSSQRWPGATRLLGLSGHAMVKERVERSKGRWDFLVPGLMDCLEPKELELIEAEISRRRVATQHNGPIFFSFHIMLVLPGAEQQRFHLDHDSAKFYFTFLFPCTPPSEQAGWTEFEERQWYAPGEARSRAPPKLVNVGDCLIFDGKTSHRGTANHSDRDRVFAYIVASSEEDGNDLAALETLLMERELRFLKSFRYFDQVVKVGDFWTLQGNAKGELWPCRIVQIFHERGNDDVLLTVQWFYEDEEASGKSSDPKERLYSKHLDETPISSLAYKCRVIFFPKNAKQRAGCDYWAERFWDHRAGKARPLTQEDIDGKWEDD